MSTLSVRKLPKEIDRALRRAVRATGKTKTAIVVDALAARLNVSEGRKRQSIREFFTHSDRRDMAAIRAALEDFEKVDEELWK